MKKRINALDIEIYTGWSAGYKKSGVRNAQIPRFPEKLSAIVVDRGRAFA